jgi:hypothetical protein
MKSKHSVVPLLYQAEFAFTYGSVSKVQPIVIKFNITVFETINVLISRGKQPLVVNDRLTIGDLAPPDGL